MLYETSGRNRGSWTYITHNMRIRDTKGGIQPLYERRIMHRKTVVLILGMAIALTTACEKRHRSVTTYHNDNLRTGWNSEEERLTPAKVGSPKFGLLHSVVLDDQVDAQPLVSPDERITSGPHQGKHDVVYVATESNTIYAIDASSGSVAQPKR